jgi:hypothetical protein
MATRVRHRARPRQVALAVVLAASGLTLLGLGCGQAPTMVAIKGTVTFQGQPVTEGLIQFNDHKTGHGADVTLRPDGTYDATLPPGDYAVVVLPPILVTDGKTGPVDMKFKKVRNIPAKYHSTATSGLTAAVRADKVVHDFDLSP